MALIISAENIAVGQQFRRLSYFGDVTTYTCTDPVRAIGRGEVIVPVAHDGGAILLDGRQPVLSLAPAVVRPLRADVHPNEEAWMVAGTMASWDAALRASVGRSSAVGVKVLRTARTYRPERDQFAAPCDGDQDWRV